MKKYFAETIELAVLTGLSILTTGVAALLSHKRTTFMVLLSVILALMLLISRFRHGVSVQTIQGRGRRRHRP